MDKADAKKIDLISGMTHNLSLTTQNIVAVFQVNGIPAPEHKTLGRVRIVRLGEYLMTYEDVTPFGFLLL